VQFKDYKTLRFDYEGRILRVTIDRAERMNVVNQDLHEDLARVFVDLNRDPDSDIIILTGAGRAFCAGGDLTWLQGMKGDPAAIRAIALDGKLIVTSLLELEKPIICRLNGAAAGLGATVALLCDIIIAADDAVIGDPHVRVGVVAGDGGAVIWPQLCGYAKAKEYLLTGDMVTAQEAERIGLINHVVPAAELDAKVDGMARKLAGGARHAIRWTKTVTNIPLREMAAKVMDASLAYELLTFATEDHQEAVSAFRERRKPEFTGR